jgi:hypothetical protein
MTEEDEEFNRIEREASLRKAAVSATVSKREWVGLTEDEIDELHDEIKVRLMGTFKIKDMYLAIEAKLREKNEL